MPKKNTSSVHYFYNVIDALGTSSALSHGLPVGPPVMPERDNQKLISNMLVTIGCLNREHSIIVICGYNRPLHVTLDSSDMLALLVSLNTSSL